MKHILDNGEITVTLSSEGGSLTSLMENGREYLWQGDPAVWSGQAPICFPICGGLRDGRAHTRGGREITLARHGFARKRQWHLRDCDATHAAFELSSTPTLLEQFPFPFRLTARYRIAGRRLEISYEVENTGDDDMPFFIGGHPGFACPLDQGERYEDYEIHFERPETATVPRAVVETGLIDVDDRYEGPQSGAVLPLTHELFAVSETIYDQLESRSVELTHREARKGVRLEFSDLPYLIIWGKPAGDFVAIEPWGGLSTCSDEGDIFEEKRGCLIARPGETVARGFAIEVL